MIRKLVLNVFFLCIIFSGVFIGSSVYGIIHHQTIEAFVYKLNKLEAEEIKNISTEEELIKALNGEKDFNNVRIDKEIELNGGNFKTLNNTNIVLGEDASILITGNVVIDGDFKLKIIGICNDEEKNKKPRDLIKKINNKDLTIKGVNVTYSYNVVNKETI